MKTPQGDSITRDISDELKQGGYKNTWASGICRILFVAYLRDKRFGPRGLAQLTVIVKVSSSRLYFILHISFSLLYIMYTFNTETNSKACQLMILISTPWSFDKFTHLVDMTGSDLLKGFLDGVFAQVSQISPSTSFESSRATYGELAAWETTFTTPHTDAHEVYLIERARYCTSAASNDPTKHLDIGTRTSGSFTDKSIPTSTIPTISITDRPTYTDNASANVVGSSMVNMASTCPDSLKVPGSSPGRRSSTSSWRRLLDSAKRYLFPDLRRDKGKGTAIAVF